MKLSVIIVNYNVRAYLEQCLRTVFKALEGIEGEVFVVDNLSTDGSVEMVREKFPQVRLIANQDNVGFSRANNQAVRESTAEHVLLLNPDTVVGEDVFRRAIAFLDAHPRVGGLGVKMIDGTGRFLRESKRGLPTPAVAFYKIIGLTRLFPRSKVFGRYHLGHLPEDEAAPIEILSGACMFLRKKTLDQVGLLDESFFMYGEDIDLSYRITLGGYENWYLPEARIIHYKGESTKKSSVNYVFVFYNAMAIFARKHFTRRGSGLFAALINGSIYLSAAAAIVARFLHRTLLPLLDVVALAACWSLIALLRGEDPGATALEMGWPVLSLPVFMLFCFGLVGGYDRPVRLSNLLKGALCCWALWALLSVWVGRDGSGRVLVPGALAVLLLVGTAGLLARAGLHLFRVKGYRLRIGGRRRVLAIGNVEHTRKALALLWQTHFGLEQQVRFDEDVFGQPDGIPRIAREVRRKDIDEVVLCAEDLPWQRIIAAIEHLRRCGAEFKIAQPSGDAIIGPSTIESLQDLLILEGHAVSSSTARRRKNLLDVGLALGFLLTLPIGIWFVSDKRGFVANILHVIARDRTWVGYHVPQDAARRLPDLLPGVIDPVRGDALVPDPLTVYRVNLTYAKDYRVQEDLRLVWKGFAHLGAGPGARRHPHR